MANPIQQGLKPEKAEKSDPVALLPQWLIQYNKD